MKLYMYNCYGFCHHNHTVGHKLAQVHKNLVTIISRKMCSKADIYHTQQQINVWKNLQSKI